MCLILNGNITSKNGLTFTYEEQTNKLIKVTSSGNSIDIAYNTSGYMSSITGSGINYSLVWTGNKLSTYNLGDIVINYEYDYTGRRIRKIINNSGTEVITKYYYEGDNLIKEVVINTEKDEEYFVNYIYDNNGLAIGFEYNNNCYYYVRDITGVIEKVIDKEGIVVKAYTYDAYGVITSASGSLADINSIKYKGYYYDIETGWFWLSSRYYSPELCRFISPDDVEYLDPESVNGLNLYCYCMNNPVMYSDGSGHMPEWLGNLLTGIGIVVGTALFVAAIVASAGTVGALVGVGAAAIGLSTTAVSTAITVATISTYVVAGGVALFGASDAVEAFSGGINPIRDYVMGGNQTAYNITSGIFNTLGTVACIAGMVGPKILQKIAQHGGVPKISNGKTVGYSMDFFDKKGNWSFRIDATTHGNPKYHYNPHIHYLERDVTQGGVSKGIKYLWEIIKGWF